MVVVVVVMVVMVVVGCVGSSRWVAGSSDRGAPAGNCLTQTDRDVPLGARRHHAHPLNQGQQL